MIRTTAFAFSLPDRMTCVVSTIHVGVSCASSSSWDSGGAVGEIAWHRVLPVAMACRHCACTGHESRAAKHGGKNGDENVAQCLEAVTVGSPWCLEPCCWCVVTTGGGHFDWRAGHVMYNTLAQIGQLRKSPSTRSRICANSVAVALEAASSSELVGKSHRCSRI